MADQETRLILLWDGACDFCRRCVEWIDARDTGKKIKPIPYQDIPSPPMTGTFRARCGRSIQLFLPGRPVLSGGKAALAVLSLLGWRKTTAFLAAPPLVWGVEAAYWIVSRNRKLFSWVLRGTNKKR
ncbi:MAG: DCC1-like thiol-disulfide oxidoreductase family protein [bacterium]